MVLANVSLSKILVVSSTLSLTVLSTKLQMCIRDRLPVNTDSIATVALTGLSENLYELQLLQSQVQLAERQKR